jgi:hypothetical protein
MGIPVQPHNQKTKPPVDKTVVSLPKEGKNDKLQSEENVDPVFQHHAGVHKSQPPGQPGN